MASGDVLHNAAERSVSWEALTHGLAGRESNHEEAVVIHISLNRSSEFLRWNTGRRRLCGGTGLLLLLQASPILSYPLQHQLALLFLLSSLSSGLLSNTVSLLLLKVTLVRFDAGLDWKWFRGQGA